MGRKGPIDSTHTPSPKGGRMSQAGLPDGTDIPLLEARRIRDPYGTQFSIARRPKGAQPLLGVSLKDNGARSDHFSSFASSVALLTSHTCVKRRCGSGNVSWVGRAR